MNCDLFHSNPDNYYPRMEGIPKYILNLAKHVKWTEEQACFQTFCHQTSLFYAIQPGTNDENDEMTLVLHLRHIA